MSERVRWVLKWGEEYLCDDLGWSPKRGAAKNFGSAKEAAGFFESLPVRVVRLTRGGKKALYPSKELERWGRDYTAKALTGAILADLLRGMWAAERPPVPEPFQPHASASVPMNPVVMNHGYACIWGTALGAWAMFHEKDEAIAYAMVQAVRKNSRMYVLYRCNGEWEKKATWESDKEGGLPWCDDCRSYHAPDMHNPLRAR